jgi:short-subunit dehydrogenase
VNLHATTALVTGANRGIGRAIAEELARQPLRQLLLGTRTPEEMAPVRAPSGGAAEIRAVRIDLSSRETIEACLGRLPERDQVDVLVNNAGRLTSGLLEEHDLEEMYAMFQVNLVSAAHLTRALLPGMLRRRRGMIVNNASISGYANPPGASAYAAAKAGVVAFSESLRRELRGTGVGVLHLVTPGVATRMGAGTVRDLDRHMDTRSWGLVPADEWAAKVVHAIRRDDRVLGPGGRLALAKLASRGPAAVLDTVFARSFRR